ncbi:ferritin [bacterium]|nr:ferritin [bacterium]
MSDQNWHEQFSDMSDATKNTHRALISLIEELEAVDWYQQRMDGCTDEDLTAILKHNRDEEWEHAAMLIEWLRRNHKAFADELEEYFNKDGDIADH